MQTILAMIFSYLVFVSRAWGIMRFVVVCDVVLALLYDFTPLRLKLGVVETVALCATFVLWLVNMIVDRRPAAPPAPPAPPAS
ncbi:MAG TPA: hypothetical protein VFB22_09770 [Candidatus Baltobacteraceae bacterium]|nr:hypothetical protein [Candidatus Baltobacteraceae bacterium]